MPNVANKIYVYNSKSNVPLVSHWSVDLQWHTTYSESQMIQLL